MGTRNLTAVFIDGEYKVAQYGQWDGYPDGQGAVAYRFAKQLVNDNFKDVFRDKVRAARFISADEFDERYSKQLVTDKEFYLKYPEFTRDTGSSILNVVFEKPEGISLVNEIDFAADSLFCEWAWVIDLDANTFEAFKGFNREPLTSEDRFYFLKDKEDTSDDYSDEKGSYHGVKLVKKWDLDRLPETVQEFIDSFN